MAGCYCEPRKFWEIFKLCLLSVLWTGEEIMAGQQVSPDQITKQLKSSKFPTPPTNTPKIPPLTES